MGKHLVILNYFRCGCSPIKGTRYKCKICEDYDLCEKCHKNNNHKHKFAEIKIPIPNL